MAWYIARNGKKKGPLKWDDLPIATAKGELNAEDLVWTPTLRAWVRAGDTLKFLRPDAAAEALQDQRIDGPAPEGKSDVKPNRAGYIFEAPSSPSQIPPGPITAHWRGEVSLATAYWINGLLVSLVATAGMVGLGHYVSPLDLTPKQGAACVFAIYAFAITLAVWQWVGIWRSASRHHERGGKRNWAYLAKASVILGAVLTVAELSRTGAPLLIDSFKTITGQTDIPEVQFHILREGRELELAGGLRSGSADKLAQFLDAGPAIKVVHLNSTGGLVSEGLRIHRLLKERKLTTYTATECASACAIAFLAGAERYLGANGRIGFHGASVNGIGQEVFAGINRDVRQTLLEHGAPLAFVDRAMSTGPSSIWYPEAQELIDAKIVTAVVDSKKFARSGLMRQVNLEKAEAGILRVPFVQALKDHDNATYQRLRDTLFAKFESGAPLPQVPAEVRSLMTDEIIPKYLVTAPDEPLVRYWRSQIAEMQALHDRDPELCVAFLLPQISKTPLDLKKHLPKELLDKDLANLAEVIKQTAVAPQSAELTPEGMQDLGIAMNSLLETYPNLIDVIGEPEKHLGDPSTLCLSFIRLYEGIFALNDAKRSGPLLRYLMAD